MGDGGVDLVTMAGIIAAVAALSGAATRNLLAAGTITSSAAAALLLLGAATGSGTAFLVAGIVAAALLLGCVAGGVRAGMFRMPAGLDLKPWRIVSRPFALLFIPIDAARGHRFLLVLVGSVAAVFIVADLVRIFTTLHPSALYKARERKTFSSMTAYLVAVFLVFLLFPAPVSYLSLCFLTLGDLYGKLVGIRFGRTRLVEKRTLEGSLGYVTGALVAGALLREVVPYPLLYLGVGTVAAAAIELFSVRVDDNLTVGLVTGAIITVMRLFFLV